VTREKYDQKLDLCARDLTRDQRESIREAWWKVERAADIGEPISTLTGFRQI
jgi:hypothetical protein